MSVAAMSSFACAAASARGAAARRVRCQLGGAGQERRDRRDAAARLRPAGGPLQLPGERLVRCPGGMGAVPGAPVRIGVRVGRLGQRRVGALAIRHGGGAVGGRSHERMPEADPEPDLEEPCRGGRIRRHAGEPEPVGRTPQQRRVSDGVGCSHEQQAPALLRERFELPREAELDAIRQGHRAGRSETAGELPGSQAAGQLEQRQGVAAGLADDAVAQPHIERPVDRRGQQPARVRITQPTDVESRKSREVQPVARLAHREDHAHRLREQAAGDEGEGLRRGPILPLGVVDHAEQRALLGDLGEEAQHGEARRGSGRARRRRRSGPAPRRARRAAGRAVGPGGRASARRAGAARSTPAPSRTRRRPPERHDSRRTARRGGPAARSCRRRPPRPGPGRGCDPRARPRRRGRAPRIRPAGPAGPTPATARSPCRGP